MKKNLILMFVAVMALLMTACKDDEAEYSYDGAWNVDEMNTVNEKGDILNHVEFQDGESVITIDRSSYKEEINKGGNHIVSTGVCTRSGNTYDVKIQQSNMPKLEGQHFTLEFTKVVEEGNDTKAEIYSRSGETIRTGRLTRHNTAK